MHGLGLPYMWTIGSPLGTQALPEVPAAGLCSFKSTNGCAWRAGITVVKPLTLLLGAIRN